MDGAKFIAQDDAYFSYAEFSGGYDKELEQRQLEPEPQFIIWKKEYELAQKYRRLGAARLKKSIAEQELIVLTDELKAEGVIIDESTSTSEDTGSKEQSIG